MAGVNGKVHKVSNISWGMGLHPSPRCGIIGVIRSVFDLIIADFFPCLRNNKNVDKKWQINYYRNRMRFFAYKQMNDPVGS